MKHWPPDPAAAKPLEPAQTAEPRPPAAQDAWIEWLTHAPLHGVSPDRWERGGGAGFLVLITAGAFWIGAAWMLFGR